MLLLLQLLPKRRDQLILFEQRGFLLLNDRVRNLEQKKSQFLKFLIQVFLNISEENFLFLQQSHGPKHDDEPSTLYRLNRGWFNQGSSTHGHINT